MLRFTSTRLVCIGILIGAVCASSCVPEPPVGDLRVLAERTVDGFNLVVPLCKGGGFEALDLSDADHSGSWESTWTDVTVARSQLAVIEVSSSRLRSGDLGTPFLRTTGEITLTTADPFSLIVFVAADAASAEFVSSELANREVGDELEVIGIDKIQPAGDDSAEHLLATCDEVGG